MGNHKNRNLLNDICWQNVLLTTKYMAIWINACDTCQNTFDPSTSGIGRWKYFPQYKERVLKLRSLNVCPHAYHVNQRAWCIIVMPAKTMDIIGILGIYVGWGLVAWYWKLDRSPVGGPGLPWSVGRLTKSQQVPNNSYWRSHKCQSGSKVVISKKSNGSRGGW